MPLEQIVGLDHVMILVQRLDDAAQSWRQLGFTVSPRGIHSTYLGTANYTIMLRADYIELIGVVTETPHNLVTRDFLARRGDGLDRIAMRVGDAAACVEEIRGKGYAALGPFDFGRPVTLPGGVRSEAKFRVFHWPVSEAPGDLRLRGCQHLTPENVWVPDFQQHANTVTAISRVEILAHHPHQAAQHMARLIESTIRSVGNGEYRVPSGSGRAEFVFFDRETLARRYRTVALDGLPEEGAVALVLRVADLDAAARAVGPLGVRFEASICVPASAANGVILRLEET